MKNQQGAPEARCQACIDRHDGFYGSWAPDCPRHNYDGTPRSAALVEAQQPADCGNTPYDEGPFTLAQQPAPSAAAAGVVRWAAGIEGSHIEVRWTDGEPPPVGTKIYTQPSPTPQADSQPAPQGETNAQLDTDSNSPTPRQQRDVAGPVAVGQPVGHGSDSTAGDPSAQGNKLLTVAERNIRSFLRSAVFKSGSDREAALSCVDVLWAAASAPADSVTAPAGGEIARLRAQVETLTRDCGRQASKIAELIADLKFQDGKHREDRAQLQTIYEHQRGECWYWQGDGQDHLESLCNTLPVVIRADQLRALVTTQPAQAADSVLEDAARYRWLRNKSTVLHNTAWLGGATAVQRDVDFLRRDDALAALDAAIDAARKKGCAT